MPTQNQVFVVLTLTFTIVSGQEKAFAGCPTPPSGYDCQCNAAESRQVCATWDQGAAPVLDVDFTVDYDCTNCEDAPRVEVITGDSTVAEWNIYSQTLDAQGQPTGPANLGDVLLADDVSPNDGNFAVSITKPSGFGAVNVGSINLDSDDDDWEGFSVLGAEGTTSNISGTVGDILVVERDGNGGTAEGTTVIWGDVEGDLTIPHIEGTVHIFGNLGDASIETISAGGQLRVEGNLQGLDSPITLNVTDNLAGTLLIEGDVVHQSVISIADFEGSGELEVKGATYGTSAALFGAVNLENGIDSVDASVIIWFLYGQLDLHGYNVNGVLSIGASNSDGEVIDGATLNGVANFGIISELYAQTEGSLNFDSVAAGGEIITPSQAGAMEGIINIEGDMDGLIKMEADLQEGESGTGLIHIVGDLGGTVDCEGDVASTGEIKIDGAMTGTSTIVVDGACDGKIRVGKNTTSNTLIHCKSSLGSTGSIVINSTGGNYSAAGDITVGSSSGNPVAGDFDGCIGIHDESGTGNGGDLGGVIRIAVCDDEESSDPDFDHNVCIDGEIRGGSVDIVNDTCDNEPSYSCNQCYSPGP